MARFLVSPATSDGHFNPFVPIVRRLVECGHEVAWLAGEGYREKVERTGARFHPYPRQIDQTVVGFDALFPEWHKMRNGLAQTRYMVSVTFAATPTILHEIDTLLASFPADVLVSDTVVVAPYLKTELGGPPSAGICVNPLVLASRDLPPPGLGLLPNHTLAGRLRDRLLSWLVDYVLTRSMTVQYNQLRRSLGLAPLEGPFTQTIWSHVPLVMQLSTPAFEFPRSDLPRNVHFVGPILTEPQPGFRPPPWWPDLKAGRPVVLVNQGTLAVDPADLIRPAIEALKDEQMLVVAVPVKPGELGELPDNVRAELFIPFRELLPYVDVMVTNGGYGGTQSALSQGIPLVVAGVTEDKMEVAARVEWSGAGINLHSNRPAPAAIRKAVREVFANSAYRTQARRIQADFARYDAPAGVMALLEDLARPPSPS
ncbi:MAG: glycosyltransferase [Nitrososphaerales archaeon]